MSTRKIIEIDDEKCTGCGLCIPNCPEGALQVIDGKVRLVSDLFCDGLGACIGYCPEGAIRVVEREAQPYDECRVMANIARQGANTIRARRDASNSTGNVTRLNSMITPQAAATMVRPTSGWISPVNIPINGSHITIWLAYEVIPTAAIRHINGR
jgi:MinD superfamily P-loop ATPase